MGSPAAPASCGAVAAMWEFLFHQSLTQLTQRTPLFLDARHVDNRVLLHFPDDVRMPVWRLYTDRELVVTPLLLDDV